LQENINLCDTNALLFSLFCISYVFLNNRPNLHGKNAVRKPDIRQVCIGLPGRFFKSFMKKDMFSLIKPPATEKVNKSRPIDDKA